jgi:hypothetical protein
VLGLAARVAVGAGDAGGDVGGVALATFLLQPANDSSATKTARKVDTFNSLVFTLNPPFAEVGTTLC